MAWSAENSYRNGENAPGESLRSSSATYGTIALLPTPHSYLSKGSFFEWFLPRHAITDLEFARRE